MNDTEQTSSMQQMIQQQIIDRGIRNPRVLDAMLAVPRDIFFAPGQQDQAFADNAAPIGHGQTISQPYIVALMTERLDVQPTHRVLEIGTGSGYQTAILARLAKEVFTIERIKPLLDEAWERLMHLGLRNIRYRNGDGTLGWPEAAPFDRMIFTAGAPDIPRDLLLSQLADGGLAICPVGPMQRQMLTAIRRDVDVLSTTDICLCKFVKLLGKHGWADPE